MLGSVSRSMGGIPAVAAAPAAVSAVNSARVAAYTTLESLDRLGERRWDASKQAESLSPETLAALQNAGHGTVLTQDQKDEIGAAAYKWAIDNGCTTFSHNFHPMRGPLPGQKADTFLKVTGAGAIHGLDANLLFHGESDGSSFPSGGLRETHAAGAYTGWDVTSELVIRGDVLVIPSAFITWAGSAIDEKTPLLRSQDAVNKEAMRLLRALGDNEANHVICNVGWEQEFFLVDRENYLARPDLVSCGRALIGNLPARAQQASLNYFGRMPSRVRDFLHDVRNEMWALGIPLLTLHNEVAPSQYETAPVFAPTNVAADNNVTFMEEMNNMAADHGLAVLFHEKPFAGINGSGKHCNWGLNTDTGKNLFKPGKTDETQSDFVAFTAALVRAIHLHGDVVRAGVASASNDHRLGAQEAPPAIMSINTGTNLEAHIESVINGGALAGYGVGLSDLDYGTPAVQPFMRPLEDRNRTAPIPFCGNRFEFRAVGGNQHIAMPLTFLHAAVADSCATLADAIEGGASPRDAVASMLAEHKAAIFCGDGYDEKWQDEAAARGLLNNKNTPTAMSALFDNPKNQELFEKTGIFSPAEFGARVNNQLEAYTTAVDTEARCLADMIGTGLLPAATASLSSASAAAGAAGGLASWVSEKKSTASAMAETLAALNNAIAQADPNESAQEQANYAANTLIPAIDAARTAADAASRLSDVTTNPFPSLEQVIYDTH